MMFRKEIQERNDRVPDEQAMQDVMALLDEWQVPEPSAWFDSRMMARFREEQARPAVGLLARLRDRFEFGNQLSYKPVLAGAMALVLLAGGGGYLTFMQPMQHTAAPASATLQDLQVLDNNDQAIQQMDQLLDGPDESSAGSGSSL